MSIFEHHHRARIYNPGQHLLKHTLEDFAYVSESLPGVTNVQSALDYILAVLYPQTKPSVDTVGDLPSVGNTINDFRVVLDDGDGKAAGYRWEQREGEVSASWHKIYDIDWGQDSILQQMMIKTQDLYVSKKGYDERDASGNVITGTLAGAYIYGGASANTNLTLYANSGDGVGASTGYIQFGDNARPITDNTFDLGTTALRFKKMWSYAYQAGTLVLAAGSITDTSGEIDFDDEDLVTTGDISGATLIGTTGNFGTLSLSAGSITDSSGAIDFGDEDLTTAGTFEALTVTTGTTLLAGGSITDSSGEISFDNENLTTTGTLDAGNTTVTRLDVDNIRLDGNTLSITDVDGDLILAANGVGIIDVMSDIFALDITATGTLAVTGEITVDNLSLNGRTLSSTDTDGDLILDPNGAGLIQIGAAFYPVTNSAWDIGRSGNVWNKLWLDGAIGDGTTEITSAVLQSLRDINAGVALGMTIFWDGSKWVASYPDTEIDHGSLSGLGDDDHTQYLLLAGRSGG